MADSLEAKLGAEVGSRDGAVTPPPACALDAQALGRQRERYLRLARSVAQIRRERELLIVDFAPNLDRALLDELIAVERECCPFFTFSFEERSRSLEVGVREAGAAAALDAIAHGFSAR